MVTGLSEKTAKGANNMARGKWYVMVTKNGRTLCENHNGYTSKKQADEAVKVWLEIGWEAYVKRI